MRDINDLVDKASEASIIGTLINHPEFITHIDWFKPSYFHLKENSCMYIAIHDLIRKGVTNINEFNIQKSISDNPHIGKILEGFRLPPLGDIIDAYTSIAGTTISELKTHIERVVNLSYRREALKTAKKFQQDCLNESNTNLNELNMKFHDEMNTLASKYIVNRDIDIFGTEIDDVWADLEESRSGGTIGIASKFDILNRYFTYRRGELVILGGRAKAGKSAVFLNEIHHKLKQGIHCAYFDTENGSKIMLPRMIALESGVTIDEIEKGTYMGDEEKEYKVKMALEFWKKAPFVYKYDPCWSFEKIYTIAKTLKYHRKDFNLDFLVFDYIKDTGSDDFSSDKVHYLLGEFANFLKNNVAGELDIPILSGAQMSPTSMKLADSDSLNRYASVVAYWYQKTKEEIAVSQKDGNYKMTIEYNRFGNQLDKETEYINFHFLKKKHLIEAVEDQYQPLLDVGEPELTINKEGV